MTDERKDREHHTEPRPESDEHVSEINAKKLTPDEEGKVKGGHNRSGGGDVLTENVSLN